MISRYAKRILALSVAASFILTGTATAQPVALKTFVSVPGINPTHFRCYTVTGDPARQVVKLRDQFQATPNVLLGYPQYLCAPVIKNDEKQPDMTTHLTCYKILEPIRPNRLVRVTNQFGSQVLRVADSQILCVPSRKTVLATATQSTPLTPQKPCLTASPAAPGVRYGTANLALGADVPAGGQAEITLLFNTYAPVTPPPMVQFDAGGPKSAVIEFCISTPQKAPVMLGPAVTWKMEDPFDPGKNTPWARFVFSPIAGPLGNTMGTTTVNGHGVIKVDVLASTIAQAMLANQQYFNMTPTGQAMIALVVGGQTYKLHITVAQE